VAVKALSSAGVATFSTNGLAFGPHSITAEFAETANFVGSSSAPLAQDIRNLAVMRLISSANPAFQGNTIVYTVTLDGGANTPTGTVRFYINGVLQRNVAVVNGRATFVLPRGLPSIGNFVVRAIYSGDSLFVASLAQVVQRVVNRRT